MKIDSDIGFVTYIQMSDWTDVTTCSSPREKLTTGYL